MTWSKRKNASSGSQIRHSLSRAERVRSRALGFERQVLARRERATQVLERRRNAFQRAGLAFRMWWLSLLGVVSTWLAPIRSRSESFGKRVRQDLSSHLDGSRRKRGSISRLRNHGSPSAVFSRQPQSLEQRLMLTSDLTEILNYSSLNLSAQDTLQIEIGGTTAGANDYNVTTSSPLTFAGTAGETQTISVDITTGAVFAGVDLMHRKDLQPVVIEVNAVPGWRGLEHTCQVPVAVRLLEWIEHRVHRPHV